MGTLSSQSVYVTTVPQSSNWTTDVPPDFVRISISNAPSSSGSVTITGGGTKQGVAGTGIVLGAGESITISVTNDTSGLVGISVTTAAGTTARIIAQ